MSTAPDLATCIVCNTAMLAVEPDQLIHPAKV
jgi:hypothetical protein